MPGEDPFKRVPMMVPNEKPSNLMEMEKTLEAMEASIDHESSQELDSSDDMTSLDVGGMSRPPRALQTVGYDPLGERVVTVVEHRVLNQRQRPSEGEEMRAVGGASIMPDLLTSGPPTQPDIQLSSQPAVPDVTAHSRNPLAPGLTGSGSMGSPDSPHGVQHNRGRAIDLLHNTSHASQPLDLTDGLLGLQVGPQGGGQQGET